MRWVAVLLCAVSVALVGAGTSSANQVEHFRGLDFSFTFVSGFYTDECGFEVTRTVNSTDTNVTLFYDKSGNIVREQDTSTKGRDSFSAASTGKSFSYPSDGRSIVTEYPEGAFIGAPAIVTFYGMGPINAPGVAPNAGVEVYTATVVDFSPEGIPIWSLEDLIESHGNRVPQDERTAAVCSALGGP